MNNIIKLIFVMLVLASMISCGPQRSQRPGNQLQGQWKLVDTNGDGALDTWINDTTGQSMPLCDANGQSVNGGLGEQCLPPGITPEFALSQELQENCMRENISEAQQKYCLATQGISPLLENGLEDKLALAFAGNIGPIMTGIAQLIIASKLAGTKEEAEKILKETPVISKLKYKCPKSVPSVFKLQGIYKSSKGKETNYLGTQYVEFTGGSTGFYTLYSCSGNMVVIVKGSKNDVENVSSANYRPVSTILIEQLEVLATLPILPTVPNTLIVSQFRFADDTQKEVWTLSPVPSGIAAGARSTIPESMPNVGSTIGQGLDS